MVRSTTSREISAVAAIAAITARSFNHSTCLNFRGSIEIYLETQLAVSNARIRDTKTFEDRVDRIDYERGRSARESIDPLSLHVVEDILAL